MLTTLSASFETPDMAGTALGRVLGSGIPISRAAVDDIAPFAPLGGEWESGDLRPGRHKTLFERSEDGNSPDPDVYNRGSRLTLSASAENTEAISGILRNSGALNLRLENSLN